MILDSAFYPVLKGIAPWALVICREMWQEAVGAVAFSSFQYPVIVRAEWR